MIESKNADTDYLNPIVKLNLGKIKFAISYKKAKANNANYSIFILFYFDLSVAFLKDRLIAI